MAATKKKGPAPVAAPATVGKIQDPGLAQAMATEAHAIPPSTPAAPQPLQDVSSSIRATTERAPPSLGGSLLVTPAQMMGLTGRQNRPPPPARPLSQACTDCHTYHAQWHCPLCRGWCVAGRGNKLECCRCHVVVGHMERS